ISDMWMPPHTTRPPFFTARKAAGTSAPTGAKMMAASSGSGGASSEPPAQARAERAREALRVVIAGPGEGMDAAALPDRDLGEDVGGGAEAVDAEALAGPGHAVAAPAGQSRAHEP